MLQCSTLQFAAKAQTNLQLYGYGATCCKSSLSLVVPAGLHRLPTVAPRWSLRTLWENGPVLALGLPSSSLGGSGLWIQLETLHICSAGKHDRSSTLSPPGRNQVQIPLQRCRSSEIPEFKLFMLRPTVAVLRSSDARRFMKRPPLVFKAPGPEPTKCPLRVSGNSLDPGSRMLSPDPPPTCHAWASPLGRVGFALSPAQIFGSLIVDASLVQ
ncbi:hypothetical protein PaG_06550 [Moesziomyces aphidis]|uniref:Uncharacterized protein n=1 Tax=Moesziomyces aphidis TaxID=84754 RepID=W3VFW3_MOEAP|nr:hypothetical protein PaG_06550 [Moesziomyces aphidis]